LNGAALPSEELKVTFLKREEMVDHPLKLHVRPE
jgi:hypothetical protein